MTCTTQPAVEPNVPPAGSGPARCALPGPALLCAAAGLMVAAAFPPFNDAIVLPIGLAMFFAMLAERRPRHSFLLGICFGYPAAAVTLFWLTRLFGVASISLWAIAACWPATFGAVMAWLGTGRLRRWLWLAAPVVWTGLEVLRDQVVWPRFSLGGIAYPALTCASLWPVARVLGGYGITFLVVMAAAIIAQWRQWRPAAAGVAALWLALALWPKSPMAAHRSISVRLVQAASEDDETHFALGDLPSAHPLDAIVWSEYSFLSDPRHNRRLWPRLRAVATAHRCLFVFGAEVIPNAAVDNWYNTAFVLGQTGALLGTHTKNHPVPMFHDGIPGTDARVFPSAFGPVGVGICYDFDSPDVSLRLARAGATVLLAPSDNPGAWGPVQGAQQRQILQMRAAETGLWLGAADTAGSTFACDAHGHEIARTQGRKPAVLDVTLGLSPGKTLFTRAGWMFGWLCVAAAAVLGLLADGRLLMRMMRSKR